MRARLRYAIHSSISSLGRAICHGWGANDDVVDVYIASRSGRETTGGRVPPAIDASSQKRVREWKASPDDLADEARLLVTRRKKTKQERDGLTCDTADSRDSPEAQRKRSCRTQGDSCNTQGRTLGPPPLTRSLNRLKYSISVAITAAVGQR